MHMHVLPISGAKCLIFRFHFELQFIIRALWSLERAFDSLEA